MIDGNQARIEGTLEEYYDCAKKSRVDDVKQHARSIYADTDRKFTIAKMSNIYFELHIPHTQTIIQ